MDIVIGSAASIPNPPTGYATLFINTDVAPASLYTKYPDGTVTPYSGSSDANASCIAETWTRAVTCALQSGQITSTQFVDIMEQGLIVTKTSNTDTETGEVTSSVSVGSRPTT